jgi:hypothetical protein
MPKPSVYEIDDEGRRLLVNLQQHYEEWTDAQRASMQYARGRLTWKTVSGRDYLYRIVDSRGNGRSLGARSEETERQFDEWVQTEDIRRTAADRTEQLNRLVMRDAQIYKALRLPRISSEAAEILRALDQNQILGQSVMVVGTTAIAAYEIEASWRFAAAASSSGESLDTTQDFDLTWVRDADRETLTTVGKSTAGILEILKQIDSTYTVNTERHFQARNAAGYEVELLLPRSLEKSVPANEALSPVPLEEQDWLLGGTRVDHVVVGFDGKPARIIAPDPRLFALHKLWLAEKPGRSVNKIKKDRAQGNALLRTIVDLMPHYPLDEQFTDALAPSLRTHLDRWKSMNKISVTGARHS